MTTPTKYEIDRDEYEKTIREIGWDEDCIFAALNGFTYASSLIEKKDREISRLEQDNETLKKKVARYDRWLSDGVYYTAPEYFEMIKRRSGELVSHTSKVEQLEQQIKSCEEMMRKLETALNEYKDQAKRNAEHLDFPEYETIASKALASLTEWRKKNGG